MSVNLRVKTAIREYEGKHSAPGFAEIDKQLGRKTCALRLVPPSGKESSGEQLYRNCCDSVLIVAYKCNRCSKCHHASGFIISDSGALVTSYHVLNDPKIEILFAMSRSGQVYGIKEVLAANEAADLAILQLEKAGLHPLPLNPKAGVGGAVSEDANQQKDLQMVLKICAPASAILDMVTPLE